MKQRRKRTRARKRNGAGTAVVGFILGSLFPPLGLGSAFAGYRPGTFWSGASWGGGIAVGLYAIGAIVRAVSKPALPADGSLGAQVKVGGGFTANVDSRAVDVNPNATIVRGVIHFVATNVDPTLRKITGVVADPGLLLSTQGVQVIVPFDAVTAVG